MLWIPKEGVRLPKGYKEVEYLESSGTQYIDTGYTFTSSNYDIEAVGLTTVQQREMSLFAVVASVPSGAGIEVGWSSTLNRLFAFNITSSLGYNGYEAYNKKIKFHIWRESDERFFQVDNATVQHDSNVLDTNSHKVITHRYQTVRWFSGNLYSLKIKDNGVLVRDFVPCYRKSDNKPGMYDLANTKNLFDKSSSTLGAYITEKGVISSSTQADLSDFIEVSGNTNYMLSLVNNLRSHIKRVHLFDSNKNWIKQHSATTCSELRKYNIPITTTQDTAYIRFSYAKVDTDVMLEKGNIATTYEPYPFYTNAGTGEFGYGYYEDAEYLESSGTQYINTGIYGDQDTRFVVKYTRTGATSNSAWQGAGETVKSDTKFRVSIIPSGAGVMCRFGDVIIQGTGETEWQTPYDTFREVTVDKNKLLYDGVKVADVNYSGTFRTKTPLWLAGASGTDYKTIGKVAYAKIYQNDKLTHKYKPKVLVKHSPTGVKSFEGFMYDTVTKEYKHNNGTGVFGFKFTKDLEYIKNVISDFEPKIDYIQDINGNVSTLIYLYDPVNDVKYTDSSYVAGPEIDKINYVLQPVRSTYIIKNNLLKRIETMYLGKSNTEIERI